MKFKKIVSLIAISSVVTITMAACSSESKPDKSSEASKNNASDNNSVKSESVAPMEVTADELLNTLSQNALKATNTYKDKYIRLTGKLSGIDAQGKYFSLSPINGDLSLNTVMCNIEEQHLDKVMEFQTGQIVTVIGTITDIGEVFGYTVKVETIESSVDSNEANKTPQPEPAENTAVESGEAEEPKSVENSTVNSNESNYDIQNTEEVGELVTMYGYSLVDAINYNDFSLVAPTLVPGSTLYSMQNNLVRDLNQKGISEEVIEFEVLDISKGKGGKYSVNTYEKIKIYYGDGTSKVKEFYWTYDVLYNGMHAGLANIKSTN